MTPQIAPSNAGSAALRDRKLEGPVTLRNLLRFSARADDGLAPHHAPDIPVIGRDACARYEAGIAPRRAAADGEFVFSGRAGAWLPGSSARRTRIGAPLLRQASVARFLAFAQDRAAQDLGHHRTAALSDIRVLPLAPAQAANT